MSSNLQRDIKIRFANTCSLMLTLCFLFFSQLSIGQDFDTDFDINPSYSLTAKISPQHLFWGGLPFSGEYGAYLERRISPKTSIEGGLAYVGKGLILMSVEADTSYSASDPTLGIRGFRVQGAYKFYLNMQDKNTGLFVAPHLSFNAAKYFVKYAGSTSIDSDYIHSIHTDISAVMGMRWVLGRFSMETFAGGGYRNKQWITKDYTGVNSLTEEEIRDFYLITKPIVIKMGFLVGFEF